MISVCERCFESRYQVKEKLSETYSISTGSADTRHDSDDDMLLHRERARVDRDTEDGHPGHKGRPSTAERIRKKLGDELQKKDQTKATEQANARITNRGDGNGRETKEEELVDARKDNSPDNT